MKYILVLGILFKKFKNPADVVVSVGDRLIDTFQLEEDYPPCSHILSLIDRTWYEKLGKSAWLKRKKNAVEPWDNIPRLFKIYHINKNHLHGNLQIKVHNENSDYTNGFIRNSSQINFPIIALIPDNLVDSSGEKLMKIYKRFANAIDKRVSMNKNLSDVDSQWPNINRFYCHRQDETHEKSDYKIGGWSWIGGSFTVQVPIKNKHHIKYLGSSRKNEIGFPLGVSPYSQVLATCRPLLNTYNEDQ